MLTLTPIQAQNNNSAQQATAFIRPSHQLKLAGFPQLACCYCQFDKAAFKPTLFNQLAISQPEQVKGAVLKRQAEYLAGRYAAKQALSQLDIYDFNIATGQHRAPIWPNNILGSITHSGKTAIALTSSSQSVRFLGVDHESWLTNKTVNEIQSSVINQTEKELLLAATGQLDFDQLFALTFSAKESLFKALYPSVGYYFDFNAANIVELEMNDEVSGGFTIELKQQLTTDLNSGMRFSGYFSAQADLAGILTLVVSGY